MKNHMETEVQVVHQMIERVKNVILPENLQKVQDQIDKAQVS